MSDKIRSRVLLIVLLIGLCAALALCARRVGLEAANSRRGKSEGGCSTDDK